jgi:hypothetical protein
MFFKKNKSAPLTETQHKPSSQSSLPEGQSLFAPAINPIASPIDFGFGPPSPLAAAPSNALWETATPEVSPEASPADYSNSWEGDPTQAHTTHQAISPMPSVNPDLSPEQAWNDLNPIAQTTPSVTSELTAPYLEETVENYIFPTSQNEEAETLWQTPDDFAGSFNNSFETGAIGLSETEASFATFSDEMIPAYESLTEPLATPSDTSSDSSLLDADFLLSSWEEPTELSFDSDYTALTESTAVS